jgi:hypothetical protein
MGTNPKHRPIVEPEKWAKTPQMLFENPALRLKWEAVCQRCGDCCKLPNGKDCEHLLHVKDGKTCCKLYPHHLGTILDKTGDEKDWMICTNICFAKTLPARCAYRKYLPEKEVAV